MGCVVRPFLRRITPGIDVDDHVVSATVEGGTFVLELDGLRIPIPAVATGDDDRGQYAVLEESNQDLHLGFQLTVEAEYEEPSGSPCGSVISVTKPHPDQFTRQAANPNANVIMPVEWCVSVHFASSGEVNGTSGGSGVAWDAEVSNL